MFTEVFFPSPGALLRKAGELLSPSSCIFGLIWECVHIWIINCSQQPYGLHRGVYGCPDKNLGSDQKKEKCLVQWELSPLQVCTRHWEAQSGEWPVVPDQVIDAFTKFGGLHWSWTLTHEKDFSRWRIRGGEKGGGCYLWTEDGTCWFRDRGWLKCK